MESNDNIKIILKDNDNLKFKLDNKIEKVSPPLENLEINPSKEEQTFKSQNYYGYNNVTINPVTNSIDENIKPENIKKDVSILGVKGNIEELNATEISVNPTSEEQIIVPQNPYNGFSKVTIGAQTGINPDEYFKLSSNSESNAYAYIKKYPDEFYENIGGKTSYSSFFQGHIYLEKVGLIDTSKCTQFSYMFNGCANLKELPQYNTSKGVNFNYAFNITSLEKIPLLDLSLATNIANMLNANSRNLRDVGGFKDLGKAYLTTSSENYYNYALNLSGCYNLTYDSLMNIINNLYDIKTKGCNAQKLQLGSINKAKLTDEEIAIATNKGWNVV